MLHFSFGHGFMNHCCKTLGSNLTLRPIPDGHGVHTSISCSGVSAPVGSFVVEEVAPSNTGGGDLLY